MDAVFTAPSRLSFQLKTFVFRLPTTRLLLEFLSSQNAITTVHRITPLLVPDDVSILHTPKFCFPPSLTSLIFTEIDTQSDLQQFILPLVSCAQSIRHVVLATVTMEDGVELASFPPQDTWHVWGQLESLTVFGLWDYGVKQLLSTALPYLGRLENLVVVCWLAREQYVKELVQLVRPITTFRRLLYGSLTGDEEGLIPSTFAKLDIAKHTRLYAQVNGLWRYPKFIEISNDVGRNTSCQDPRVYSIFGARFSKDSYYDSNEGKLVGFLNANFDVV